MSKKLQLKKINNLAYFTKEHLKSLFVGVKENTLDQNIFRWLRDDEIYSLKRGLYVTKDFVQRHKSKEYLEFIASILKKPSYLSIEYVLRQHEILTEITYGYTSVTLKTGGLIDNDFGSFRYRSIKSVNFVGYKRASFLNNDYLIASKAKALFDYIYFKARSLAKFNDSFNYIGKLRLNLGNLTEEDLKELAEYLDLEISYKLELILKQIIKNASDYR